MPELVPIPSPGTPLVYGTAGAPLAIVLPDRFGRLPWLEPYAAALADRAGLRVVVPDLYDGVATIDEADADRLAASLAPETALGAISAAIAEARAAGSMRIAVVGFDLGGEFALRAAQRGDTDAVVAYYATLGGGDAGVLPCPVMLHIAEDDSYPLGAGPEAFAAQLRDDGTPLTSHVYSGTVHGFANATLHDRIDARAAALAFARTATFLETRLGD